MSNENKPKAVLDYLVTSLVKETDEVIISEVDDDDYLTYEVQVAEGEMGKVIGKRGRTAQAVRTVVRSVASSEDTRVSVDFVD